MKDLKQRCEDMARNLEDQHKHGVISYTREAADLLRECAGGVRAPTRQRLAQIIQGESGHADDWALARADDVLAALEPASDHDQWNAAIEATADVVLKRPMRFGGQTEDAVRQSMADAIRALKKGQTDG